MDGCVRGVSHVTLRVPLSVSHLCTDTRTCTHTDNSEAFILFSPSSVSVVSDTVNLSQFPPLIIIKKRKLLHSPLNTPTCLLLSQPFPYTKASRSCVALFQPGFIRQIKTADSSICQQTEHNTPHCVLPNSRTEHFNLTFFQAQVVLNKHCCAPSNAK